MNSILFLEGKLKNKSNNSRPGHPCIPVGSSLSNEKISRLLTNLSEIIEYWKTQRLGFEPLVSVIYTKIAAKSNRIANLFAYQGISSNQAIVGARFTEGEAPKHIITYCISTDCLSETKKRLEICMSIVQKEFNGHISSEELISFVKGKLKIKDKNLSKTSFAQIIKDCFFVEKFILPFENVPQSIKDTQIVTLFDTGLKFEELIKKLNLKRPPFNRLDDITWLVDPSLYAELYLKAPYLIANECTNFKTIKPIQATKFTANQFHSIPQPSIEPTIGVIDTLFDKDVYFSEWVDFRCYVDEEIIETEDYKHGTSVTSLIVDGPTLNPYLDDGCGRFRVRHFGVAKNGKNNALDILNKIKSIVLSNKDIKVWNLSLGSEEETNMHSISPEAAVLDDLQYENDVIFVVSGTNNNNKQISFPRIGAPADSINSIVVNAVDLSGKPTSYSRQGPVLCFFNKPDVSTFGGDGLDKMVVFSSSGLEKTSGTSFAAPWVSRKLAYLIHIMKFPREVAKAIILDAAAGWSIERKFQPLKGVGIVPRHINEILKTPDNEIKFIIKGISEKYDTYAYNIPIPETKNTYPFVCKATLCYFPKCSRNQGVDYTDTELDIHFGRIHGGKIKSIDNNIQGDFGNFTLYEEDARKYYGKWDNSKFVSEGIKEGKRPKKKYPDSNYWGLSIKSKERLENRAGKGLHFGLIITLREIENKNRIGEFVQLCSANNWFVNEIDIDTMNENYISEEAEISFED